MRTYITAVLLVLLFSTIQCKKDNDSDNGVNELQGSWRLAFTSEMNGPVYPAPGSLSILKFDGYKMLTYAHDTLLKTEPYYIRMQKDTVTQTNIPCIVPALSSYSGAARAFSVHNDTLTLFTLYLSDGGARTYTRYKP